MSLPYSYKNSFNFDTKKTFDKDFVKNLFFAVLSNDTSFKEVKINDNKLSFKSKKSLLNFFYNVELDVKTETDKIKIDYKINLVEVIVISIFLFVFIPFFSKFSLNSFFIFSVIIIFIFYTANVMFMIHQLRQYFNSVLIANKLIDEIELSGEQQDWLNNPNKCPACGCDITENTIFCPDCGLKISQNPYTKPLDLSKPKQSQNQNFKYHYKEKK